MREAGRGWVMGALAAVAEVIANRPVQTAFHPRDNTF